MSRENLLFGVIGILLGFIVGFMFASSMSQRTPTEQTASALPTDHPPVGSGAPEDSAAGREATRAQVTADIEKARAEPNNFEAQLKAAERFYRIGRFDGAIEFLLKANQIKPTDYDTVVTLGIVNLDAKHYDQAEKWYRVAMKMKPEDAVVLAGLAEATLQKGDAKGAEEAIAKLEKADSSNQDLPGFRQRLTTLKSGK